ncbi:MAG: uncharacterized protein K0Q85_36 [Caproiciproducens sp.]|jgi:hypothetical protein|nr:uncharacterized protein [Caproiciproducens sp.]
MADTSPRLGFGYIKQSQSGKEITFAEFVNRCEVFIQPVVESMTLTAPPAGVEGKLYVIATGATGDWTGKAKLLAQYIDGAWAYFTPVEGLRIWDKNTSMSMVYKSSTWQAEITANGKIGFFGATPVTKTTVTMTNTNSAIGGLTIGATYSQVEVQALRDGTEILADDVRAIKAALSALGAM